MLLQSWGWSAWLKFEHRWRIQRRWCMSQLYGKWTKLNTNDRSRDRSYTLVTFRSYSTNCSCFFIHINFLRLRFRTWQRASIAKNASQTSIVHTVYHQTFKIRVFHVNVIRTVRLEFVPVSVDCVRVERGSLARNVINVRPVIAVKIVRNVHAIWKERCRAVNAKSIVNAKCV